MITERHRTMLRAIAARPRTAREFTNAVHDSLSPHACTTYLNELVRRGWIEINEAGLYEATEAGHEYLSHPPAAPRTYCNATTTGRLHRDALECAGWWGDRLRYSVKGNGMLTALEFIAVFLAGGLICAVVYFIAWIISKAADALLDDFEQGTWR